MGQDASREEIQAAFKEFLEREDKASNDEADEYWYQSEETSDDAEKAKFFAKGMEEGSALCAQELGKLYLEGKGVPKDLEKAEQYLQKAAECGLPIAMFLLGQMSLKKDADKGFDWLCKSAIKGNVNAYVCLGDYITADPKIRRQIEGRVSVYFQEIEHKTNLGGRENQFKGWCYATGICCSQDFDIAQASWIVGIEERDFGCKFLMDMYKAGKFPPVSSADRKSSSSAGAEEGVEDWPEENEQNHAAEKGGSNLKAILSIVIGLISMGELTGLSIIGMILGILAVKSKPGALAVIGIVINAISLLTLGGIF